jgi:hypothetical protein
MLIINLLLVINYFFIVIQILYFITRSVFIIMPGLVIIHFVIYQLRCHISFLIIIRE